MDVTSLLKRAVEEQASDLFIVAGMRVSCKIAGKITATDEAVLRPDDTRRLVEDLYQLAGRSIQRLQEYGDDDFSLSLPGVSRFRVSAYRQRGSLSAVVRVVHFQLPDPVALNIPEGVMELANITKGLVLVTGPANSGKSTTLACLIDRINNSRSGHIITLEDPIEYLHSHKQCIVSQRELSSDTESYISALRAALRQSPDVILLGEMRDAETIATAMTAAETGHLVLSTLHTVGAANTIDRIIDAFPADQQEQIRIQLSAVLRTVVSQVLLPDVEGGLTPAFEVMHMNPAIRSMIRDCKTHQIAGAIAAGVGEGMVSLDQSILELFRAGRITRQTAVTFADNPDQLQRRLGQ